MSVQGHLHDFERTMRAATQDGFRAMGSWLAGVLQDMVSIEYPPASDPGESPRLRTGDGRASIGWQEIPDGVRIGNDQPHGENYMIAHNQGIPYSSGMQVRPWLSRWPEYVPEMMEIFMAHARRP